MYNWRKMTPEQRRQCLALRRNLGYPWHSPPHQDFGEGTYHLTAACFEHRPIIGISVERMAECETRLLDTIRQRSQEILAWCILPTHYHLLVQTSQIKALIKAVGRFHGRQSYLWNGEDGARGRQVWDNCVERGMRSEGHFWATMNYVHHNPAHHRYVGRWQDWPFSSARDFLKRVGKDEATRIWNEYPVLDYGKGWDEPEM
jgi:putative transposase